MDEIVKKMPTDLQNVERSVFMQKVENRKKWQFQTGVEEGINIPIFKKIGFQQQDRQNSQNLNKGTFIRLPVTSAQCLMESEKYPDSAILLYYDDDD